MQAYSSGEFEQALAIFKATEKLERVTDGNELNPSRLYQQRCQHLLEHPTQDWDGIWSLTSK